MARRTRAAPLGPGLQRAAHLRRQNPQILHNVSSLAPPECLGRGLILGAPAIDDEVAERSASRWGGLPEGAVRLVRPSRDYLSGPHPPRHSVAPSGRVATMVR